MSADLPFVDISGRVSDMPVGGSIAPDMAQVVSKQFEMDDEKISSLLKQVDEADAKTVVFKADEAPKVPKKPVVSYAHTPAAPGQQFDSTLSKIEEVKVSTFNLSMAEEAEQYAKLLTRSMAIGDLVILDKQVTFYKGSYLACVSYAVMLFVQPEQL